MNYTIEEYLLNEYNAASKARKDVSHFILQNGFRSLFKNEKTRMRHNKWAKLILTFRLCMKLMSLKKNDILFIQTSLIVLPPILRIKAIKQFKLIYLIHDLYCLKYNTEKSIRINQKEIRKDMYYMSKCDYVIAHNNLMVEKLKQFGCTSKLIPLGIFDYDCSYPRKRRVLAVNEQIKVTFAGFLGKANFLTKLDQTPHKNYQLFVYGIPKIALRNSIYKGNIDADMLPNVIEGHFGLIWEGEYDANPEDNYMCVNNPHKLSMYIVAGLPIIAWNKSAAARFIETNGIGLTVDTLDEVDKCVKEISPAKYSDMVNNCLAIRERLVHGDYLRNALNMI